MPPAPATLLQVVQECHNSTRLAAGFVPVVFRFELDDAPAAAASSGGTGSYEEHRLGSMPRDTAKQLSEVVLARHPQSAATMRYESGISPSSGTSPGSSRLVVAFPPGSVQERTEALDLLLRNLANSEPGRSWMRGWRDERYAIYGWKRPVLLRGKDQDADGVPAESNEAEGGRKDAPLRTMEKGAVVVHMERAACALFGVATFGVHCTAYTPTYQIWVPRRSSSKSTFPSMLDNSVAGGITAGESPLESMVRECAEEAGLPDALVRHHLVATGAITYFYQSQFGFAQPELEFTYDLPLPETVIPHPVDGEAESFTLYTFSDALQLARNFHFKPNCALVLIDFGIRHGLITPENEPHYMQILRLLHADLGVPVP